jgi:orotate phosphoribosyltransferase
MSYLTALDPVRRPKIIARVIKALRPLADKFDTITFKGLSGALVAPVVADALKKQLVAVRSEHVKTHGYSVERARKIEPGRYVVIDDFVASGDTLLYIHKKMEEEFKGSAKPVGTLLYHEEKKAADLRRLVGAGAIPNGTFLKTFKIKHKGSYL